MFGRKQNPTHCTHGQDPVCSCRDGLCRLRCPQPTALNLGGNLSTIHSVEPGSLHPCLLGMSAIIRPWTALRSGHPTGPLFLASGYFLSFFFFYFIDFRERGRGRKRGGREREIDLLYYVFIHVLVIFICNQD